MKGQKDVVAAVDLSECSEEVLRWAKLLAERFDASVQVVHIVPDVDSFMAFYVESDRPLSELQKELEVEAQEKMIWLTKKVFGEETCKTFVLRGHPVEDLIAFLKKNPSSMVVLGCHGRRKPEHKLFGSTAERLLKASPCPVVTVGQDYFPHS